MLVVEPVLAFVTLNHVLVHLLKRVGFLAVAVAIEKGLVVDVLVIGQVVLLVFLQLTCCVGHVKVPAVTAEVELAVQFTYLMTLVAAYHAAQTESVRLDVLGQLAIAS